MEDHYARNLNAVMEWMADHVMWIGPVHSQFVFGKNEVRRILGKEQDVVCMIPDSSYEIIYGDENICITVGRLVPHTADNSEILLSAVQRVTFVFTRIEGRPQVIHMHVSNDWEGIEEDETFPYKAGREAFLHMQKRLAQQNDKAPKFSARDIYRKWHYIANRDIIYISADNYRSVIHTVHGSITVPLQLSQVEKKLPEQFVRVHRSYIVNTDYVIQIKRYSVYLYNGIKIPIPQKKYEKVKRLLLAGTNGLVYIY
ncbi:LytTR family transcriptional regulator [Christensenella intestinihominis]|nr:LytTR family transcriptional regulator [Christensenella intestinihominis]